MMRPSSLRKLKISEIGSMEEIREAALAYYENESEKLKQLARQVFDSLDVNGDGRVSAREYIELFSERSCALINHPRFFQELDRDGNGSLDFDEFLTLYYILKSPRPFCDGCGTFLKGLHFTCIQCFDTSTAESFDLCASCYRRKNFNHPHHVFLDNHTLLASKKPSAGQMRPLRGKAKGALDALDAALSVGSVAVNICTSM